MAVKSTPPYRIESDPLGEMKVPVQAYYGVQTARAVENFRISGLRAHPKFIWATAAVKRAAAEVNAGLGLLDPEKAKAIMRAAEEVMAGRFNDQFVVDVYQAGAGTSHNMNANEVIANRAIEILGGQRGQYRLIHPNDHVNMAQSTNDVFPTAMRLACLASLQDLLPVLEELEQAFRRKAEQFDGILKSARTHLQDAVPMRLGQEFGAYGRGIQKSTQEIRRVSEGLRELGIGGSAAGTGLNTHPLYRFKVIEVLRRLTEFDLYASQNLFEAMNSMAPFVNLSGALRSLAVELTKIANDVRLLSSGPKTGLAEIILPAVQPGSSMMPGKVNPVMAEMLNMVCFQVMGNDLAVAAAAQAGQLELNVMMPVIIFNLLWSMDILAKGVRAFTQRCVVGIEANRERCREYVEKSMGLATALNPWLGYEKAAAIAKEANATGKTIRELVLEKGVLSPDEVERIFSPSALTEPGIPGKDT